MSEDVSRTRAGRELWRSIVRFLRGFGRCTHFLEKSMEDRPVYSMEDRPVYTRTVRLHMSFGVVKLVFDNLQM